jgi:hypothetical protein
MTALMLAAINGHTACVQVIVAAKAALDIKTVSYTAYSLVLSHSNRPAHPSHTSTAETCFVRCCVCVYEQ